MRRYSICAYHQEVYNGLQPMAGPRFPQGNFMYHARLARAALICSVIAPSAVEWSREPQWICVPGLALWSILFTLFARHPISSASLPIANKVRIVGIWYPSLVLPNRRDFEDRFLLRFTKTAHQAFEPRLMRIICLINLMYPIRLANLASLILQC